MAAPRVRALDATSAHKASAPPTAVAKLRPRGGSAALPAAVDGVVPAPLSTGAEGVPRHARLPEMLVDEVQADGAVQLRLHLLEGLLERPLHLVLVHVVHGLVPEQHHEVAGILLALRRRRSQHSATGAGRVDKTGDLACQAPLGARGRAEAHRLHDRTRGEPILSHAKGGDLHLRQPRAPLAEHVLHVFHDISQHVGKVDERVEHVRRRRGARRRGPASTLHGEGRRTAGEGGATPEERGEGTYSCTEQQCHCKQHTPRASRRKRRHCCRLEATAGKLDARASKRAHNADI
mmetsp:Transcript_1201/g.2646  ORF Transcript_1201/g.2646 Transcript_1201/m.2646 type:complete len:292 (+) Transcript_1201:105-980(+)